MLCLASAAVSAAPLTLEQLIAMARANEGRVREAQAELRILRGKYQEARWAWFPVLQGGVLVAGPTPEARNDGYGGPPTTEATRMYDLNFGQSGVMFAAEAQAVLPLFTFGKLSALEDLAAKGVEVGQALVVRAQDEAELQTAQAYWGLQFAREGKLALLDTIKRIEESQLALKRLREAKSLQVTQMDVYKLEFYRKQAEARLSFADQGAGFALAALRLLIGLPQGAPIDVARQELPEPSTALKSVGDYVQLAREYRPELRAITAGLAAREKEVFIKSRMFYPDFGLAGFARWKWTTSATRQLSPFAYDPYNDLSAGLALVGRFSLDVPQKLAQLEQSKGELEKLERQKDLLVAGIGLEIEKTWSELSDALARAAVQTDAEKNARRWATSAYAAFDLGTGDTRELVDSFTALGLSSTERLKSYYDAQVGYRALARVVGTDAVLPPVLRPVDPAPPSAPLVPEASSAKIE